MELDRKYDINGPQLFGFAGLQKGDDLAREKVRQKVEGRTNELKHKSKSNSRSPSTFSFSLATVPKAAILRSGRFSWIAAREAGLICKLDAQLHPV
jgi:hypothetical protein